MTANSAQYNQFSNAQRNFFRIQFLKARLYRLPEERVPLRSSNNSQFLNCSYSAQHSVQGLNFFNQMNIVSQVVDNHRRKQQAVALGPDDEYSSHLYSRGELKKREEKAQAMVK